MVSKAQIPSLTGGGPQSILDLEPRNPLCLEWLPEMLVIIDRIPIVVIKLHNQKHFGEERVYFSSVLSGHRPSLREVRARSQGRNLEAETKAEAMEEHQGCYGCLFRAQDHMPMNNSTHKWSETHINH